MSTMILRGDLKDIYLPGLVELICHQGKSTGIVFERPGQTAVLYFQDGELLDASAGKARGDEAVYELLGWHTGTFELVDVPAPPERTIERTWNQLILEGAQKLDEGRNEEDVEDALVTLISTLEQLQLRLKDRRLRKRPRDATRLCVELANHAVHLCSSSPTLGLEAKTLAQVLAAIAGKSPGATYLSSVNGRLTTDSIEATLQKSGSSPAWSAVQAAILDVLERYLEFLVGRLRSPDLRELWSETCARLMRDLRGDLEC